MCAKSCSMCEWTHPGWEDFEYGYNVRMRSAYRIRLGAGKSIPEYCAAEEPPCAQELDSAIAVFSNPSYTYTIPMLTVGDLRAHMAGEPLRAHKPRKSGRTAPRDLAPPLQARGVNLRVAEKKDRWGLVALLFNGKQRCQLTLRAAGESRELAADIMIRVRNEYAEGSLEGNALHERKNALLRAHFKACDGALEAADEDVAEEEEDDQCVRDHGDDDDDDEDESVRATDEKSQGSTVRSSDDSPNTNK